MTTLGLFVNRSGASENAFYNAFDGQTVDANAILVKHTWSGDADVDGAITADDYRRLDKGFLERRSEYAYGDFNYDGVVDVDDYSLIDTTYLDVLERP